MRRFLLGLLALVAAAAAAGGAFLAVAWHELEGFREAPFGPPGEVVVLIAPGSSPRTIVRQLAQAGVLADDRLAWRYVRYVKRDPRPLKAGEYAFQGAARPDEVLEKLYRGEVVLHGFTIPEGLRAEEIAEVIGRSGLADAAEIRALAGDPAVAQALGVPGQTLEGWLFPDTYRFPRGTAARAIVEALVRRAQDEVAAAEKARGPGVTLEGQALVTLASIVEKETGTPSERPRVSCVFHNRLRLGIKLATDPTVMYATWLRTGHWSRNITRADLQADHPYNTYLRTGLPPGPIASPGAAALRAAAAPSACKDLYFVSRNDGTHVFCPDWTCHAAAVRRWQVEYFRKPRR